MTKHLYGLIVTHYGAAANNRGETEGNITTLQKLYWNGDVHSSVSAESIRWAIRYYWQTLDENTVNRKWNESKDIHEWKDNEWNGWNLDNEGAGKGTTYLDDDVLGFMVAQAANTDGSDELKEKQNELQNIKEKLNNETKGSDNYKKLSEKMKDINKQIKESKKGFSIKRKGALEVTRAISLTPFLGEITFNSKSGEKSNTSLYGTEVHATRFQYGFAITPESLKEKNRIYDTIDAIANLSNVGGNQSRFLYDFSPEAVVFRWTDDFAPRILYGFSQDKQGAISIPSIEKKVESNDIKADELIVGGNVSINSKNIKVNLGIKDAVEELKNKIKIDLNIQ